MGNCYNLSRPCSLAFLCQVSVHHIMQLFAAKENIWKAIGCSQVMLMGTGCREAQLDLDNAKSVEETSGA